MLESDSLGYREREAELRRQSDEDSRVKYDGHNRRPLATSVRDLSHRRARRRWHRVLGNMARQWCRA